jgi:hypothetical protein
MKERNIYIYIYIYFLHYEIKTKFHADIVDVLKLWMLLTQESFSQKQIILRI